MASVKIGKQSLKIDKLTLIIAVLALVLSSVNTYYQFFFKEHSLILVPSGFWFQSLDSTTFSGGGIIINKGNQTEVIINGSNTITLFNHEHIKNFLGSTILKPGDAITFQIEDTQPNKVIQWDTTQTKLHLPTMTISYVTPSGRISSSTFIYPDYIDTVNYKNIKGLEIIK